MNKTKNICRALLVAGALMNQTSCAAIRSAVTNKVSEAVGLGGSAGTVTTLWTDVPPIEGATKSALDLPITVKIAVQAFMKASTIGTDVSLDKFDFIAYKTSKTPEDVTTVYSKERMSAAGWTGKDQPGCIGGNAGATGSGANSPIGGGFCLFAKQGATKGQGSALIIATLQDESAKQTNVWYIRFSGTDLSKK